MLGHYQRLSATYRISLILNFNLSSRMIYVLFSVCFSVLVAVLIKLARKQRVDVQQLVLWNYPTTVALSYYLFSPSLKALNWKALPYEFYLPLMVLLPTLFIFIALSVKYSGIVKTDIAQRMSLFVPLIASFLIFNESLDTAKIIGILAGLLAMVCSVSWGKGSKGQGGKTAVYPLIVFIGMGVIDILFKQIAQFKHIPYTTSMFLVFVGAMLVAGFILWFKKVFSKSKLDKSAIIWGLVLGLFNFANIYYYMKAHRAISDNPSVVFTAMNVGVIILGSLIGVIAFNEKLSSINKIGLVLAVASILLISYL